MTRTIYLWGRDMETDSRATAWVDTLLEALQRQSDCDDHDRGLIAERLRWTPEERLDANTAFLRFYFSARPNGPLIRE